MSVDTWGFCVERWHAQPDIRLRRSGDNTDAHQGRCVRLAYYLFPDDVSMDLIYYLAHHDTSEGGPGGVGDVPHPAKNGALGDALHHLEADLMRERGVHVILSSPDMARAMFIDRLDAYRWAKPIIPDRLDEGHWVANKEALIRASVNLGVYDKVMEML